MTKPAFSSICLTTCLVVWLVGLAVGFAQLANYGTAQGERGPVADTMPVNSAIDLPLQNPTLVMFVHPKCPCTRASLGELNELIARYPEDVDCYLIFVQPAGCDESWTKSELWRHSQTMHGVETIIDNGHHLALQFGAMTSGETMLYSTAGRLLFWGGITSARGHAGDNAGIDSIEDCLQATPARLLQTPVFGCPLFSRADKERARCSKP